jgi:hypothetical protein
MGGNEDETTEGYSMQELASVSPSTHFVKGLTDSNHLIFEPTCRLIIVAGFGLNSQASEERQLRRYVIPYTILPSCSSFLSCSSA